MDQVEARQNGKYTCLDCKNDCKQICFECKNWNQFVLNKKVLEMPYEKKSKLHEERKRKWQIMKMQSEISDKT